MSDTPRTDKAECECRRLEVLVPMLKLSRQLERKLAAMTAAKNKALEELKKLAYC